MMRPGSQAFGWWLTGFADGESCFNIAYIAVPKRKPDSPDSITWRMQWAISLRADDLATVEMIRGYTGGILGRRRGGGGNQAPNYSVVVSNKTDLFRIVKHFREFPLQSKKARDFVLWSEAVELWHNARVINIGPRLGSRKAPEVHVRMNELYWELKSLRAYDSSLALPGDFQ